MKHSRLVPMLICGSRKAGMRFDKDPFTPGGPTSNDHSALPSGTIASWVSEAASRLPHSMRPLDVSDDFTPFPLPKHDASMGFGPVTLKDIPDVLTAQQRMKATEGRNGATMMEEREEGERMVDLTLAEAGPESSVALEEKLLGSPSSSTSYAVVGDAQLKVMDRLQCLRSLDDLISQYFARPQREAQAATVLDMAATIERRSNEELVRMFYELTAPFAPGGNGIQFLVAKVVKFGRPYYASDERMKAYLTLMESTTDYLIHAAPERLAESPDLCIQLLHFMALILIFEPNRWFSPDPKNPSNRGDYKHPRGVNQNIALKGHGEELFDAMVNLVISGTKERRSPFLDSCNLTQLVELLNGFAAVTPGAQPPGDVVESIWQSISLHVLAMKSQLSMPLPPETIQNVERLYLSLALIGAVHKSGAILKFLLRLADCSSKNGWEHSLGPDFFAAASQEADDVLKVRIVRDQLHSALQKAIQEAGAEENRAKGSLVSGLAESGRELLMSLKDKEFAAQFARQHALDFWSLSSVSHFEVVQRRLEAERDRREVSIPPCALLVPSAEPYSTKNCITVQLAQETLPKRQEGYLTRFEGRRVHPIRTFLSDLYYLKSLRSVFILHSSAFKTSVQSLFGALRRVRGGKDGIICTTSFLMTLAAKAHYGDAKSRPCARRALQILAQETERGRVILVPFTEELWLHDAGVVCDEDVMMWTIAAFLAREIPSVKVHTIQHYFSTARQPHHTLKGAHSPARRSDDLYNRSTPLLASLHSKTLRSVTHHVSLQKPVRDAPNKLHKVNPSRSTFLYRRDKALFDRYHVTARNVAPGFAHGALESDLRGLGIYTPDHPQAGYTPLKLHTQRDKEVLANDSV